MTDLTPYYVDSNVSPRIGALGSIPRVRLLNGETLLESLPNLERYCGGAKLWAKRDDAMELAFGGNKVRQLEYYFGAAVAERADTVLITGAVQSNFARLAAAGARKLGMACHIQLEERVRKSDPGYRNSGNVILERLLGATLHSYPEGEDEEGADRRLEEIAREIQASGGRPYVIPLGPQHPPKGALGYVLAAQELLNQFEANGMAVDEIVVASGSGNTHAGLLFGLRALGSKITVRGICVRRGADVQIPRILDRSVQIANLLNMKNSVQDKDVVVDDTYLAPGYGLAGESTVRAILLAARTEALMLDPTYTGKAMAGFIDQAMIGPKERTLVFLHSGGTPAIFAYEKDLTLAMEGFGEEV